MSSNITQDFNERIIMFQSGTPPSKKLQEKPEPPPIGCSPTWPNEMSPSSRLIVTTNPLMLHFPAKPQLLSCGAAKIIKIFSTQNQTKDKQITQSEFYHKHTEKFNFHNKLVSLSFLKFSWQIFS